MSDSEPSSEISEPGGVRKSLDPASFSVSARVALQLGRESIASSNTAIVELVKNAYDADAENVVLRFSNLGAPSASLAIIDDGHGMTENELRDYWLLIGTANKQNANRSKKKNRIQTGEKGLGRLGLDRLSGRTTLQTLRKVDKADKQEEIFESTNYGPLELTIDWGKYEKSTQRLEVIEHSLVSLENLDFDPVTLKPMTFPHGTRLLMSSLTEEWSPSQISELREELSLLLSPFGSLSDFSVKIETNLKDEKLDGVIEPDPSVLGLANWKVVAQIDKAIDGEELVSIEMTSPAHDRAFKFGPEKWSQFTSHASINKLEGTEVSRCGPTELVFYVFIHDPSISELKQFMDANRGVRVYRDGFRVKPFGDPSGEHDWLKLSYRRARNPAAISRPSWSVAYHQIVGAVMISRDLNPELSDQTNREGIVEGGAFDDLRLFADKVIKYFEGRAHQDYVSQNPPSEKPEKEKDLLKIAKVAVRKAERERGDDGQKTNPSENLKDAIEALDSLQEAQKREKEYQKKIRDDLDNERVLLTSLASLGVMTACFGHERANDTTEVLNHAARLKKYLEDPQGSLFSQEETTQMLDSLLVGAERVEAFAKFSLNHVRPWKRKRSPVNLKKTVTHVFSVFNELLIDRYRVQVSYDWGGLDELIVAGWVAGWESVFINLVSNSCWALELIPKMERKIKIAIRLNEGMIEIDYSDSGRGVEAGTELDIFRPGFSTKRDHHDNQIGTGMGLALIETFLKTIHGRIEVMTTSDLGGARFLISMKNINKE